MPEYLDLPVRGDCVAALLGTEYGLHAQTLYRAMPLTCEFVVTGPLEEQRAIAEFLDRETARIDTLIDEQQRLIELLRERRAAYQRSVAASRTVSSAERREPSSSK